MPKLGETRSRVYVTYWEVPAGTPFERVPHNKLYREYIDLMEHEGWKLEKTMEFFMDSNANRDEKGNDVDTYVVRALFSRPTFRHTIEVPDHLVEAFLSDPKFAALEPRLT